MIKDITQAVIAVLIVVGAIYAVIANLPGKEYLTAVAGAVVGFYFKDGVVAIGKAFGCVKNVIIGKKK